MIPSLAFVYISTPVSCCCFVGVFIFALICAILFVAYVKFHIPSRGGITGRERRTPSCGRAASRCRDRRDQAT